MRSNSSALDEQFVDRVARGQAEPAVQLAAAVERPGQDRLEEAVRRREIGHRQQGAEQLAGRGELRPLRPRGRQRAPQRLRLRP